MSSIASFYAGKSVTLFGASGYVGRGLIEKLLRSCPEIASVNCLVQTKKGQSGKYRLEKMKDEEPIFRILNKKHSESWKKVNVVECNYEQDDFGISQRDRDMLCAETNVAVNSLGEVGFRDGIRSMTFQHIYSAMKMTNMMQSFKNLQALVYNSTVAVGYDYGDSSVREILYPAKLNVQELCDLVAKHDDAELERIGHNYTKCLEHLKDYPSYYPLCKNISENYFDQWCKEKQIPFIITRAPWVQNTAREPAPGLVDKDCKFLLSQIILALGKGYLKKVVVDRNSELEWTPLDAFVNTILAGPWDSVCNKELHKDNTAVYNVSTGNIYPQTKSVLEEAIVSTFPAFKNAPDTRFFVSPANEPGFETQLKDGQTQAEKLQILAGTYMRMSFDSQNSEWAGLMERMCDIDKEKFWMDIRQLDMKTYAEDVCRGLSSK